MTMLANIIPPSYSQEFKNRLREVSPGSSAVSPRNRKELWALGQLLSQRFFTEPGFQAASVSVSGHLTFENTGKVRGRSER